MVFKTLKYRIIIVLLTLLVSACKKDQCWNSYGSPVVDTVHLIQTFDHIEIGKNIQVEIYQDSLNAIILHTGDKIANQYKFTFNDTLLQIENENRCGFIRSPSKPSLIEIHFEDYHHLLFKTGKSIVFKDTIKTSEFILHHENGGTNLALNVEVNRLELLVNNGAGSFDLGGHALSYASIKVLKQSYGSALNFWSPSYILDNNSIGDLKVNLNESTAAIRIRGTGNILYHGVADSIIYLDTIGSGQLLPE